MPIPPWVPNGSEIEQESPLDVLGSNQHKFRAASLAMRLGIPQPQSQKVQLGERRMCHLPTQTTQTTQTQTPQPPQTPQPAQPPHPPPNPNPLTHIKAMPYKLRTRSAQPDPLFFLKPSPKVRSVSTSFCCLVPQNAKLARGWLGDRGWPLAG